MRSITFRSWLSFSKASCAWVIRAAALDENGFGTVDHDLADLGVRKQAFERPQPEDVIDDQFAQFIAVVLGQLQLDLVAILVDELTDPAQHVLSFVVVGVEPERGDQLLVNGLLDPIQVRNPGRDALGLHPNGRSRWDGRPVTAGIRLLWQTTLVELVDE